MKQLVINPVRLGLVAVFTTTILGTGLAMAAEDYTRYSNEELFQLRDHAQNMSNEDRLSYQQEMQNRARSMTLEERQRLRTSEDNDRGQGELRRERERTERHADHDSYGRGYKSRQSGFGASGTGRSSMGGGSSHRRGR